jgi:phosphatidate phosphatase
MIYLYGFLIVLIVVGLGKCWYSSHRPYFFEMCQPNVDCETGILVKHFECENPKLTEDDIKEMSSSFPSGHAAYSFYFAIFIGCLLQLFLNHLRVKFKFLIPTLQAILFSYSTYCSMSRLTDNFHHPNDVIFGIIIGSVIAVYFVSFDFLMKLN